MESHRVLGRRLAPHDRVLQDASRPRGLSTFIPSIYRVNAWFGVPALGPLGGHKVHKMVKFRPRGMVDKREMEQAQLFETADERGCTPMCGAAHRRESACIGGSLPSAV